MTKIGLFAGAMVATVLVGVACDEPGGGRAGQLTGDATTSGGDATTATATTTSGTDAGTTTAADTTTVPPDTSGPAPVVDPACIDGQYDEALPDDDADIDALLGAYEASAYLGFVDAVLAARYPTGRYLVQTAIELGTQFGNCIERFASDTSSPDGIFESMSTIVHECGHIADLSSAGFSSSVFLVTEDLSFECPNAAARAGKTFARSLLNDDPYAALLPGDFYKDVYLDGDPTDGTFDSGDQGYDSVLEEATQYVNSLIVDWAFRDQRSQFISITARDGILTFLWYIERYLRLARLEHPTAYQLISGNACWREATLTIWGRAWLYLELSKDEPGLGIDADTIEALVKDPELLSEIERLRTAAGCP